MCWVLAPICTSTTLPQLTLEMDVVSNTQQLWQLSRHCFRYTALTRVANTANDTRQLGNSDAESSYIARRFDIRVWRRLKDTHFAQLPAKWRRGVSPVLCRRIRQKSPKDQYRLASPGYCTAIRHRLHSYDLQRLPGSSAEFPNYDGSAAENRPSLV